MCRRSRKQTLNIPWEYLGKFCGTALSLISELVYGKPASFRDPVRFSFAHGGKDGYPYPVNKGQYDLSIQILRDAVNQTKVGRSEKLSALKRLAQRQY